MFEYQDLICALEEVLVADVMDEAAKKVHVALVIDGASREDVRWHGMLYLLLDHAIGEFNTMMHVGGLDLMSVEELPQDVQLITLVRIARGIRRGFRSTSPLRYGTFFSTCFWIFRSNSICLAWKSNSVLTRSCSRTSTFW